MTWPKNLVWDPRVSAAEIAQGTGTDPNRQWAVVDVRSMVWTWAPSAPGIMSNPMTTRGDMIRASVTGTPATPARLALGVVGTLLGSDGTDPVYVNQITSPPVIVGTAGTAITTYTSTATGTVSSWGASGLPSGLAIDSGTGAITGTPAAAGVSTVTLTATYADGSTAVKVLSVTVLAAASSGGSSWLPTGGRALGITSTAFGYSDGVSTGTVTTTDASSGLAYTGAFPGAVFQQTTSGAGTAYHGESGALINNSRITWGKQWRVLWPLIFGYCDKQNRVSVGYSANSSVVTPAPPNTCGILKTGATGTTTATFYVTDQFGTATTGGSFDLALVPGVQLGVLNSRVALDVKVGASDITLTLLDTRGDTFYTYTFTGGATTMKGGLSTALDYGVGVSAASQDTSGAVGNDTRYGVAVGLVPAP